MKLACKVRGKSGFSVSVLAQPGWLR